MFDCDLTAHDIDKSFYKSPSKKNIDGLCYIHISNI